MSSLALGSSHGTDTESRVHGDLLLTDKTLLQVTSDITTGVGGRQLVDLVRVEPNSTLSTFCYGGSKSLLSGKIDHSIGMLVYCSDCLIVGMYREVQVRGQGLSVSLDGLILVCDGWMG
jgi:hypothetical protein